MSRKTRTPEEQARREKIRALLQESNVTSIEDIQNLFKETIAEFMEIRECLVNITVVGSIAICSSEPL